jgi:hypothetical protein
MHANLSARALGAAELLFCWSSAFSVQNEENFFHSFSPACSFLKGAARLICNTQQQQRKPLLRGLFDYSVELLQQAAYSMAYY